MSKTVLVIQAHPDDAEFRVSGTVAKLVRAGEQREAAEVLGVKEAFFLRYIDGELTPSMEFRDTLIRYIRRLRPTVVMALDPWLPYNVHPDHRAAGIVSAEAAAFAGINRTRGQRCGP